MIGEDKVIRFGGCKAGEACSIVLRGASQHILDEAERSLNGPNGTGKLYQKQRALVARRWRLVGDLAEIFPIESAPEDPSNRREHPLLQIGDVPLDLGPAPSKTKPDGERPRGATASEEEYPQAGDPPERSPSPAPPR